MRIFLDITTCPRYLSLAIIRELFFSGLVGEITVGYREGIYPAKPNTYEGVEDVSFKDGPTNSISVPGYFGDYEPALDKCYIVSVGFDGWKTLNQLVRRDPSRVAILVAQPTARSEYLERALSASQGIIDRFGVDGGDIILAASGDSVAAWRMLEGWSGLASPRYNHFLLCSGNKPHSLALALLAMSHPEFTLLYNRASRVVPIDVVPDVFHWAYKIQPTFQFL